MKSVVPENLVVMYRQAHLLNARKKVRSKTDYLAMISLMANLSHRVRKNLTRKTDLRFAQQSHVYSVKSHECDTILGISPSDVYKEPTTYVAILAQGAL